jgi:hypothetical protein
VNWADIVRSDCSIVDVDDRDLDALERYGSSLR